MKFSMRSSRVLRKLRAGEVVNCFKMNLADVRVTEIASRSGFDCVWTGMEHLPNDWSVIEGQVLAAKSYDVDLLCRCARGPYSNYIRPLEMDATGIMIPHVMGLKDAEDLVYTTRFHPLGRRPVDGGNADAAFCGIPLDEYLEQANRERFVILQIEDPEPLEELEAIAELEGYDLILFGAADFSHAIGAPGQMDHPLVVDARKRIAAAANKYGKYAGAVGGPANRQELIDMGYTFISMGADVVGLSQYCQEIAQACGIENSNDPVK
jgi:4-hydroxy-2-oxoheptanedioate aldolase